MAGVHNDESIDAIDEDDAGGQELLKDWRERLGQNKNWRSARVDVVLDVMRRVRDTQPNADILLVDESVYFLDILKLAIRNMHRPLPYIRYDSCQDPVERYFVLETFRKATGSRIMLVSRGTGGQGLNMQCASVLIWCGPWRKATREEQAEGRILRPGQTKSVYIYELRARDCKVEQYKIRVRDRKNQTNTAVVRNVTRLDEEPPNARRYIS